MKFMWICCLLLGYMINVSNSETYRPVQEGSVKYMIYFFSQYKGLCSGFMVARNVAMTAALCVYRPDSPDNNKPINVYMGTTYRHERSGLRVQVTKVLIPIFPDRENKRDDFVEKIPAVLLLKRKIPDILVDIPIRAIEVQWHMFEKDNQLRLQEQCFMPGWHFHGKDDKTYEGKKYLLQKHLRAQFLYISKNAIWCETLSITFQKQLDRTGFEGQYDPRAFVCVSDGMYGSPLICKGKAVGMLMSESAQWEQCSGFSNIIHLLNNEYIHKFMRCVSSLFAPDTQPDWNSMQELLFSNKSEQVYDYIPDMYDKLVYNDEEEY